MISNVNKQENFALPKASLLTSLAVAIVFRTAEVFHETFVATECVNNYAINRADVLAAGSLLGALVIGATCVAKLACNTFSFQDGVNFVNKLVPDFSSDQEQIIEETLGDAKPDRPETLEDLSYDLEDDNDLDLSDALNEDGEWFEICFDNKT